MSSVAAKLPVGFSTILLTLAREPGHPIGDRGIGYEIVAPLRPDGHIDAEQWRVHRALCRVVRFRRDEAPDIGHLVRRPGGSWAFHYDVLGDESDEPGFHFDDRVFAPGEYVTVTEDGAPHTYEVTSVKS
ncbi:MAG: hypothetical protein WDN76_10810 [Alphaproteobacteria bacterium]